jgi:hypothetical protein
MLFTYMYLPESQINKKIPIYSKNAWEQDKTPLTKSPPIMK